MICLQAAYRFALSLPARGALTEHQPAGVVAKRCWAWSRPGRLPIGVPLPEVFIPRLREGAAIQEATMTRALFVKIYGDPAGWDAEQFEVYLELP